MKTYAGIGSRKADERAQFLATNVARQLREGGYTLRSGHAPGMDQAFEKGAGYEAEVFLPWPGFERGISIEAKLSKDRPSAEASAIAQSNCSYWGTLTDGVRALYARNTHQILGPNLDDPVDFVVCWTKSSGGGTQQALRIAEAHDVTIYNFADPEAERRLHELLKEIASAV